MENFWQTCSTQLELELTPQQYTAWIKPLVALDYEDGKLRIAAPNRFKLDWVKSQFANRITALASRFLGAPGRGAVRARPENLPKKPVVPAARRSTERRRRRAGHQCRRRQHRPATPVITPDNVIANNPRREQSRVNPELTFDNFVTGKANQLARAAAIQVANNPGVSYNPLFFYGGVGLGKTHLIHAIGNQVMADQPGARIRYIHAEQYVRDVVTAYQRKGSTTSSITTTRWTCC
jgi:chromosomal replication initiator protein